MVVLNRPLKLTIPSLIFYLTKNLLKQTFEDEFVFRIPRNEIYIQYCGNLKENISYKTSDSNSFVRRI